ncbi:MAG: valine--tRNA ligase [Clostridiales bacterium]|nr:valine--tRNA ligase [Clostridiales bacterium]
MSESMGSKYNPKEFEQKIYDYWMEKKHFHADPYSEKEPFTIVLPPPNITGQLHMGHALDHVIQDVLIRFKRMQGFEALWLPGTDHASIATEVKVLEKIKNEEGLTKDQIDREDFLDKAWEWKEEYGNRIVQQMKKLGNSCDWEKERFTMDEGCNNAVTKVFVNLYDKGLIYRGNRLINWCPDCKTNLSDAEVEHEDQHGKFYFIKYPIKDSEEFLTIATTRPETMLGDTAVAIHPEDDRYAHLKGKSVILPLIGRELPIVMDEYVDRELGTGALKITPAHDPNDFIIGQKHNLQIIDIFNIDATINEKGGKYKGMDRYDCRKTIVKDLTDAGYMIEVKDHEHAVGVCYRCNTVIEPRLSDQWFVSMEAMAKPALDVLKSGELKITPERFNKVYAHWLENIRDWTISRQLWWGHRIPAYYCQDCGEITVSETQVHECHKCQSTNIKQDEDVLDTWFSSALWPFSTLGWPENTDLLKKFYPTNVLVTGYDIIFFWVIRMVFSGIEQMKESPFEHVLIHGLVRDAQGRKMSKSLGNGVDPLEVIDQYGADALRFMLATGNSPGNDLKFQMERVESARNFVNKLWNASRFLLTGLDENEDYTLTGNEKLELADQWILSRLNQSIQEITNNLEKFELGIAATKIYEFVWDEYCDWYIELTKKRLYGEDLEKKLTAQKVLLKVLEDILKLLHPFIPFITEEIWQNIPMRNGDLIIQEWPIFSNNFKFEEAEKNMDVIMMAIKNIRNVRAEMDVPPSRQARLLVNGEPTIHELFLMNEGYFKSLSAISEIKFIENDYIEDAASVIIEGAKMFIPLSDLIDYHKEFDRLSKEMKRLEGEVKRAEGKLNNEGFVSKAPEKLIIEEQEKLEKFKEMLHEIQDRLTIVKEKL